MTFQDLIGGLLNANVFVAGVLLFVGLLGIVLQLFALAVLIRGLVFAWRALGYLETTVEEKSLKRLGQWREDSVQALSVFHHSQATRWKAALAALYALWFGALLTTLFFLLNQPAAWLLLAVTASVLIYFAVVIAIS